MKFCYFLCFTLGFIVFVPASLYAETFLLTTNISPPYQVQTGGQLSGTSIEALKCIFKKMGQDYHIEVIPWVRGKNRVKRNVVHGFFTAMRSDELDPYAKLSAPLALEKWYWYMTNDDLNPQSSHFKKSAEIGAVLGSNQLLWLQRNGYPVNTIVVKMQSLVKMLKKGRIDAFLADQNSLEKSLEKQKINRELFRAKFQRYTPLGVYIAKSFLERKTEFSKVFNSNVFVCVPEVIKLSKSDRRALNYLVSKDIKSWSQTPLVINMIRQQNKKHVLLKQETIVQLDEQWRKEVKNIKRVLIQKVLSNKLSKYFKTIKLKSKGLYAEIFVMDNKGLNVGQSDITSDYWQGDEAKFKNTFLIGSEALFIDEIKYDESSQKFQSQVSLTLSDPITQKAIGAITVGVDVEKALSLDH